MNKTKIDNKLVAIEHGLDMAALIQPINADVILNGYIDSEPKPFLSKSKNANIFLLNTHTFNQEDFDRVGEVLLCPKPLGLLNIPTSWANILRDVFTLPIDLKIDSPTRTAVQLLGENGYFVHNYNKSDQEIVISSNNILNNTFIDGFTQELIQNEKGKLKLNIKPRSRIWIKLK